MANEVPYKRFKPKGMPYRVWEAIVTAWENGLSDREASFRASRDSDVYVTEQEIKEMCAGNPRIAQLKDFLHADITSRAKLNIVDEIREGNAAMSKWYLERKAPEEFSTKAAVSFENAVVELTMAEKQEAMEDFMSQFDDE